MKIFITGAFGQDGIILSNLLKLEGHDVSGSYLESFDNPNLHPFLDVSELVPLNVAIESDIAKTLVELEPDAIFHLAGESSVASSWEFPSQTMFVNVVGTANLLQSVRNLNLDTIFVNAASVEVFCSEKSPVNEKSPMRPVNPYGVSKMATAQLVSSFRGAGMRATNAFLSNHESKFRSEKFVMGKIARGVAAIADGQQQNLSLGDLSIVRDWSSAEDICHGMVSILRSEFIGDVILASGKNYQLSDIVSKAFQSVGILNWQDYVKTDQSLLRTNDNRVVAYDTSLAQSALKWQPEEDVDIWISKMVSHFRVTV
jgi:GDPmannose 4,6-dehydratase